jgi:four helix bundle protein
MDEQEFKARTRQLALDVIRLVRAAPGDEAVSVVSRQLLRSATSIGANYRAACRGRSVADVIAKLSLVEEEADETLYWLDLLGPFGPGPADGNSTPRRRDGADPEDDRCLDPHAPKPPKSKI